MPEGFTQPAPTDVWQPFDQPPAQRAAISGGRTLTVFARIKDGVSREAALGGRGRVHATDARRPARRTIATTGIA